MWVALWMTIIVTIMVEGSGCKSRRERGLFKITLKSKVETLKRKCWQNLANCSRPKSVHFIEALCVCVCSETYRVLKTPVETA